MVSFEELKIAVGNLDDEVIPGMIDELVKAGGDSPQKALEACQAGMDIVGAKYESGEYFVADLIFAGEIMNDAAAVLKPLLAGRGSESLGKMVFCTVKGDIHDIGKNIAKSLLEAGGIEVVDLGVDVPADRIIDAVKEHDVSVVGLSGVLTIAIDSMKAIVAALSETGLRDKVRVIIGGAPVTAEYCRMVGADAWSVNAAEGVKICQQWLAGK